MINGRGKCQIFRKKAGVDLDAFQKKVKEVMNSTAQYSLTENNCIHFALYLLDLVDFYLEAVSMETGQCMCSGPDESPDKRTSFSCRLKSRRMTAMAVM